MPSPPLGGIILGDGKRSESGSFGAGGRQAYEKFCKPESWKYYVDEAIRQANVNLESVEAPAGEMKVVLDDYAYSFTDCRLSMDKNGVVKTLYGLPLVSPAMQKIGLFFCADKGAHWGGNKYARENSMKFAKTFMKKILLN